MKTEKNILIAFILNLVFSVVEFIGGFLTGSVAVISDALHDAGDAVSIGISFFLEKKSKKQPDDIYTYGYARYSVMGSVITNLILLIGSCVVAVNAVNRIINPVEINYNGMIIIAILGFGINSVAAYYTAGNGSLNQKAVNLHMLEDVFGWAAVLAGSVVMKFTDSAMIDPLMSVGISAFILINAVKNLKEVFFLFVEKTPQGINADKIREHILRLDGVIDVHHIHIRSIDGINNYATMHVVTDGDTCEIKERIRKELYEHGICHVTLETESVSDICGEKQCHIDSIKEHHHCH